MIFSMSCGHTLFFIHVLVQATSPSVSNWLAYNKYRHSDSASSGSLEMSDRMKTRGLLGKVWSLSVAIMLECGGNVEMMIKRYAFQEGGQVF